MHAFICHAIDAAWLWLHPDLILYDNKKKDNGTLLYGYDIKPHSGIVFWKR